MVSDANAAGHVAAAGVDVTIPESVSGELHALESGKMNDQEENADRSGPEKAELGTQTSVGLAGST